MKWERYAAAIEFITIRKAEVKFYFGGPLQNPGYALAHTNFFVSSKLNFRLRLSHKIFIHKQNESMKIIIT